MAYDLTTIGEGQIRLTVERGERMATARNLRVSPAGSEANVAGILAQLGHSTAWASVLPRGDLATRFIEEYRSVGVDVSHVKHVQEGRMALYFMEPGEAPVSARVTYDRLHTPFRDITVQDVDWEAMLDTKIMFVTGISAALTPQTAQVVSHAVRQGAAHGAVVVLDVNFRSLLWSSSQAKEVLEPLLSDLSILFCSRQDANQVFGIDPETSNPSEKLRKRYGIPHVISTDGMNGVHHSGPEGSESHPIIPVPVIDRPGAGDSFVAGTLHGFLRGDIRQGVAHGIRASTYALTHFGDMTRISRTELEDTRTGDILR